MSAARQCAWCRSALEQTANLAQAFCGSKCRQAAYRLRRRRATTERASHPMRLAYADPPYPGLARRYYQHEESYGGEVDHAELIASLAAAGYDGWALSTSAKALRYVLPLCPEGTRVCPWTKPGGIPKATYGPHNAWEPLLVYGGRRLQPGFRDWLHAQPARHGGTLPGRKPLAFCAFLFEQLGMLAGDELVDLFPGTGIVGRAWAEVSRAAPDDALLRYRDDASHEYSGDASPRGLSDGAAR